MVPARRLVHAAGLHADVAVLDEVDAPDPVLPAEPVEPLEERHRSEPLAVDRHGVPGLELDLDRGRHVRRLLGRPGQEEHLLRRLGPRVLEDPALVGDVEEVPVHRVRPRRRRRDRDPVALGIGHEVRARAEVPVPPGGDDLELGRQGRVGQLEAHLVVALAGRAVGDRVRALGPGDLDLRLRDQRAGERGARGGTPPRRWRWPAARGTRSRGRTPPGGRRCGPSSPRSGAPSRGPGSAPRPGRGRPCRRRSRRRRSP